MAANNKKLIKELTSLIEQIDTEGLLFLKKQATVIIHNQTAQEMEVAQSRQKEQSKKSPVKKTSKAVKKPSEIDVQVEPDKTGKFFYIVVGTSRVFFNLQELKTIVRLCQSVKKSEAPAKLLRWLKKERNDFLVDTGVVTATNPVMKKLVNTLLENYSVG